MTTASAGTTATAQSPKAGTCIGGTPLAWPRRCISRQLNVSGSVDLPFEQMREAINRSFQRWQSVQCNGTAVDFNLVEGDELTVCDKAQFEPDGPNSNAIVFISDWRARGYATEAFALTLVWHDPDTGEIFDADMLINQETRGPYAVCPDGGCTDATDLENVVTHEAGHFLGMAHSIDVASDGERPTMFPESFMGEVEKRTLAEDDRRGLCAAYPPGSLPSSCDPTPIGGEANKCTTPTKQGCNCTIAGGTPQNSLRGVVAICLALLAFFARRRRTRPQI